MLGKFGIHTAGQSVLEDLLEAQELENGQVHRGMKAQSSLVGSQGGIELDAISAIDLDLALVVLPDDAELNDSLGHGCHFQSCLVLWVLGEEGGILEGRCELCESHRTVSFSSTEEVGVEGETSP